MRLTFMKTLAELAKDDPRIILLTGDLGYMAIEAFSETYPERFFNMGVSEQNMVGVATGLAESGYIPFVYSIVPFSVLRPYEFIRNGPVNHNLKVRVVGVGGGLEYGMNGPSHYGIDDVGVMRVQPTMSIVAPADAVQAGEALRQTWDNDGPIYYRLGKDEKTMISGLDGKFEIGRLNVLGREGEVVIIALGPIAKEAQKASESLKNEHGIDTSVAVLASVNPVPTGDLIDLLSGCRHCITLEAHYVNGALGSLVSEVIAEAGLGTKLHRMALREVPVGEVGCTEYLYRKLGLSSDAIKQKVLDVL